MKHFKELDKNFGFGCMRLPMKDGEVDKTEFCAMVDYFIENGFVYFDTAHGYIGGKSEIAIKECLTSRYPRESYLLTDKLTENYFNSEADIRPFFESQLSICGVSYFDFYLMHSQNADNYLKFKKCRAYETAYDLKKEGKIKHVGLSFHDKATVLDRILTEQPQIEAVQIQLNYVDFDNAGIESRLCYEVCQKHGKPVIIMEPVKGGSLVKLPLEADRIFAELKGGSNASYAIRFAAGFPDVCMVLSGMSDLAQMKDNLSFMKDFQPLSEKEMEAVEKVKTVFASYQNIPCTGCRYCVEGCPKQIAIPDYFSSYNSKKTFDDWNSDWFYGYLKKQGGAPSDCISCGKCEHICPQHLKVRELLKTVSEFFEKKN